MQPVLEVRKLGERSYVYSVRAPKSAGSLPAACYVDGDQTSFAACLYDASQALKVYFPRVYIRYQGVCVGEHFLQRLQTQSQGLARELLATYLQLQGAPSASVPA
ncbi:MAG: hypothetical protein EOP81_16585 [Variovorax sp.]|nr:MAG: hypothetical protein EOP81_16585 [Variovorax sp.]